MMRRLPLRSRLALLSSVAVTVAIATVALISWFAVRDRLYEQLDKSISSQGSPHPSQQFIGFGPAADNGGPPMPDLFKNPCDRPRPPDLNDQVFDQPPATSLTYVNIDGTYCALGSSTMTVPAAGDLRLSGAPQGKAVWRDGVDQNGQQVRVEVVPNPDPTHSGVFLKSQLYKPVDDSLTSLAWLLLAVSVLGIGGAATTGLLVSRAALRPVDALTQAVEHVARTEDLSVRMPVSGDDEIARLSESFNAMTAALQASRDEQKRLVDDAGHELRTPLTSLRTSIDLLIRSEESGRALPEGKRTELLTGARTQMRELTVLIADLLELSRPEQASLVTAPVALHEVTARAVERVRPRGAAREAPVTITERLLPWTTHGDGAALERAVVNLLDNAVKFAPPGTDIEVHLTGGTLTVRDRGPGIAPEELPHVFERFWRSPTARAMPGSGLGLAIAARAARESGGTVTLEAPHDGPGTIARLRLPGTAEA
jgi:two-component system sensor histidine kinase MprB